MADEYSSHVAECVASVGELVAGRDTCERSGGPVEHDEWY